MIAARPGIRENYLTAGYGVRSWLLTTDHRRIALLFLATITTPQGDFVQQEVNP
ncbi:MAG: hypothetical protein ACRD96_13125 [Bryobacteraceae bacterium]